MMVFLSSTSLNFLPFTFMFPSCFTSNLSLVFCSRLEKSASKLFQALALVMSLSNTALLRASS